MSRKSPLDQVLGIPAFIPVLQGRVPAMIEACIAAGIAALLYFSLQGEMPYHDAQRFINQTSSGAFVWDIGHILLQPTALMLHKCLGLEAVTALKTFSTLSTAAAVGIFHLLLLRLNLPRWQPILGTMILAGCCSVLTLAPSAHPKLAAFPYINGAFLCLCLAERRGMRSIRRLALGGALLAVGAAYLASALATAPFAALAVLLASRRDNASWMEALKRACIMAGICGLVFMLIICIGYASFTGEPLSLAGLTGSVAEKANLRTAPIPLVIHLARVLFGSVNNLVSVPGLGATTQAWMRGQIGSLHPYAGLLPILGLWLLGAMLIAAVYLQTLVALLRRRCMLMPVAFLCGAQAWTIWYGLNDPEHWFQLTAPTILLFLMVMPKRAVSVVLPLWAMIAAAANLTLLAIPMATYPLARHEIELAQRLGPDDLLVLFVAYPGRPHAGFFHLPGVRTLPVDVRLSESGKPANEALADIDAEIGKTLQAGGHVLVADILDSLDWEAPWMSLHGQDVTKREVEQALMHARISKRLPDQGGIKLWELQSAAGLSSLSCASDCGKYPVEPVK
jgi:hypothetical protein